jgi:putative transposase
MSLDIPTPKNQEPPRVLTGVQFISQRLQIARESNDLYFAALLDRQTIQSAFGESSGILDSARVYATAVTRWVFLSQVHSTDHGCVSAVARLIQFRYARGLRAFSSQTGMYCIARDKVDEQAMHRLATKVGQDVEDSVPDHSLWLGHRVVAADVRKYCSNVWPFSG